MELKQWAILQETLLKSQLKIIRQFLKEGQEPKFKPRGKGRSQMSIIYDILLAAKRPLHVTEIIAIAKYDFNTDLNRESIVSAITKKVNSGQMFKIIATDGTLFPTNARYKGCTYFCKQCEFIQFKDLVDNHKKTSKINLADAKYDEIENYAFSRLHAAIPIIDYNPRNENLSQSSLKQRGYDRNGWPYAPCGLLARPNGFDFNSQRASFSCRRQCLCSKNKAIIQFAHDCPYWINYHGFSKHMSIKKFPRLITEVLRGTERNQKPKALRSAAERTNSTAKEDFSILAKPKIRGYKHAAVLSQIAVIVVLLKRIASFIIKVTLTLKKKIESNKGPYRYHFIPGPKVPAFILNLTQRE